MGRQGRIIILVVFLGFFLQLGSFGQAYISKNYKALELYGGIGTTHYLGDVGGTSGDKGGLMSMVDNFGFDFEQSRYGGVIGFRYIRNESFAFCFQVAPLLLSGNDKNSRLEDRGYSFFTYLVEPSLRVQYFLSNRITGLAPYLFSGVGGMIYNVKDRQHQLWSGVQYGSNVMLGIGTRLPSNSAFVHSFEVGFRYCFQDDLDLLVGPYDVGDTYYVLAYFFSLNLDRTFVYDHTGKVKK